MLDELRELRLYTFDPDDASLFPAEGTLLRFSKKRGDFLCVPHALEMIARHALFFDGAPAKRAAARADDAIAVMRDWCGFAEPGGKTPSIPGLESCYAWMRGYIDAYCARFPGHPKGKMLTAWNARKRGYEKGIFSPRRLNASDINATSFELSAARALRKGPLKRWYMAGKLIPDEVCTTTSRNKDGTYRKMQKTSNPTVIALTALCLRELRQDGSVPATGFVPINLQELSGWLGRSNEFERSDLDRWIYRGEPLFMQSSEQSGVKTWRMSQAWIDDGQWQLIDVTAGDEPFHAFCEAHEGEGFRCYRDAGYDDPTFEMGPCKSLEWFTCDGYGAALDA